MPEEMLPPPAWVDTPNKLQNMVDDLAGKAILAIDTESNSLYAYREKVCLVQVSTVEKDYLVDPLALGSLEPLGPIFSSPKIRKVFHAAEYDVICLRRDFGFSFKNLFDTMLASRILGRQEVGLGDILESDLGVRLDKRFQKVNWGKRPLPPEWLAYARLDSHYLIPLQERLHRELVRKHLLQLAEEDFRRVCQASKPANCNNGNQCWKAAGGQDLTPQQMAVLQALCDYREKKARARDIPPFKVLSNETLVNLAQACPKEPAELVAIPGISSRQAKKIGRELLDAIHSGENSPPPIRQRRRERPGEAQLTRLEALRCWRKQKGQELGVPSDVVLPKDALEAVAGSNPNTLEDLKHVLTDLPWRWEHYGREILAVIQNRPGEGK